jgi:hypothetical protein
MALELTPYDTRANIPRSIINHSERLAIAQSTQRHFTIRGLRFTIH